ncbi:hypothetical protein PYCCODRAFT_734985 [Trametes coccinea BRFM310]|uniref:Uncharacterized protein n=1 Tax=Trametes coccinea (strain BRFM310) TaxID=1353009 RepID=A0A1Y2IFF7_TRAC3|nr:hypothetical protein PYCCODRAFT_734985 [Trametes coccinea BRFM310]
MKHRSSSCSLQRLIGVLHSPALLLVHFLAFMLHYCAMFDIWSMHDLQCSMHTFPFASRAVHATCLRVRLQVRVGQFSTVRLELRRSLYRGPLRGFSVLMCLLPRPRRYFWHTTHQAACCAAAGYPEQQPVITSRGTVKRLQSNRDMADARRCVGAARCQRFVGHGSGPCRPAGTLHARVRCQLSQPHHSQAAVLEVARAWTAVRASFMRRVFHRRCSGVAGLRSRWARHGRGGGV